MTLPTDKYVPTLAVRASELNALEQLPAKSKDRLRPLFLLAPWATANTLEKAIGRIEKAYPKRPYFLDLDRDYQIPEPSNNVQEELKTLYDPSNAYENWRSFIEIHPFAQPCIQLSQQAAPDLMLQINHAQTLGREFCIRIEHGREPDNLDTLVAVLNSLGTADYAIILEGGWTEDPLSLSLWFLGLLNGTLNDIDANVPIVVSCTSMLKGFTDIETHANITFSNRELVQQIAAQTNRNTVLYGDWGSTRPRVRQGGGQRPVDRIDYPTENSWFIARDKDAGWTFKEAAQEVLSQPNIWNGKLNIWGEHMISQTAINPAFAINTPQKNVAARVNIHLHLQAFYGYGGLDRINFDEDWED
ncbi:MAG: beta family protein [Rhizobiaceae bacterium]|nr:beta family protein [Rhizobiaceae bacterium]